MTDTNITANQSIKKYQSLLKERELLIKLDWQMFLDINAPYVNTDFSEKEVQARYRRNGYDWDIHGTLYTPEKETNDKRAFVLFHGGAGSEKIMDLTPDGRPGLARVLAAQGFKALALT